MTAKEEFEMKVMRNDDVKIQASFEDIYRIIAKPLSEKTTKFCSFKLNQNVHLTLLLKDCTIQRRRKTFKKL